MKPVSRLAFTTAALTVLLLTAGGAVHATGSSLACPDWPLCFGQVFPRMVGGVLFEHSHRLLAGLVGVLTVALAVLAWRRGDGAMRRPALAAVVLVVVQGVLGGVTVLLKLPALVSTAHLAVSLLFFGLLLLIGIRAWGWSPAVPEDAARLRRWAGIGTGAVYAQALLGGVVRHTGAGLACGNDPILCAGSPLPLWLGGQLQMLHRVCALGVTVLVIAWAVMVLRRCAGPRFGALRRMAWGAAGLVLLQVALGIASVMTWLGAELITAHLTVAALLLADLGCAYLVLDPGCALFTGRSSCRSRPACR